MRQRDLNRAVAHVTGESVDQIEKMGFNLVIVPLTASRDFDRNRGQERTPDGDGSGQPTDLQSTGTW